jgi:hypothetical protein
MFFWVVMTIGNKNMILSAWQLGQSRTILPPYITG